MRSPADHPAEREVGPAAQSALRWLEHGLHALAVLALLAALLWVLALLYIRPDVRVSDTQLSAALRQWSTEFSPRRVQVSLEATPSVTERAWLAAVRRAGTAMHWTGEPAPTGLAIDPVADPKRPVRIWIAAPDTEAALLGDALGGLVDLEPVVQQTEQTPSSASVVESHHSAGRVVTAPALSGAAQLRTSQSTARALPRDELELLPVLLLGEAGWDSKFALAALEEQGWAVDARLTLAPMRTVVQGPAQPLIDTEHYAAVIVFDHTAAPYASVLAEYVDSGGGLLVLPEATKVEALAPLLPAQQRGELIPAQSFDDEYEAAPPEPRTLLALWPLEALRTDTVVLERREQIPAVATRRVGEGRVMQVGYVDSWRWRLAAREEQALDDHRRWWSQLISLIAYAPRTPRVLGLEERLALDPAPRAALQAELGKPERVLPSWRERLRTLKPLPLLFWLAGLCLLAEWASRRWRAQG